MEQHTPLTAHPTNGSNIVNHTGFVIGMHYAHQHGVVSQRRGNTLRAYLAIALRLQVGHSVALRLQPATGIEHRFVLRRTRNHMAASTGIEHAFQGQIIGLCSTTGPHHFTGIGIQQISHLATGGLHGFLRQPAIKVAAGRRVGKGALRAKMTDHSVHHRRVYRSGRRIVQINGITHDGYRMAGIGLQKPALPAHNQRLLTGKRCWCRS